MNPLAALIATLTGAQAATGSGAQAEAAAGTGLFAQLLETGMAPAGHEPGGAVVGAPLSDSAIPLPDGIFVDPQGSRPAASPPDGSELPANVAGLPPQPDGAAPSLVIDSAPDGPEFIAPETPGETAVASATKTAAMATDERPAGEAPVAPTTLSETPDLAARPATTATDSAITGDPDRAPQAPTAPQASQTPSQAPNPALADAEPQRPATPQANDVPTARPHAAAAPEPARATPAMTQPHAAAPPEPGRATPAVTQAPVSAASARSGQPEPAARQADQAVWQPDPDRRPVSNGPSVIQPAGRTAESPATAFDRPAADTRGAARAPEAPILVQTAAPAASRPPLVTALAPAQPLAGAEADITGLTSTDPDVSTAPLRLFAVQGGSASPQAPAPQSPLSMSVLAVHIAQQAKDGAKRFDIRLDPPELGRLEIRMDVTREGQVTTHLTVERPETLDLLQRDARALERALQNAGLDTSEGGLKFSLKDEGLAQESQDDDAKAAMKGDAAGADDDADEQDAATRHERRYVATGGLDIRI